MRNGTLSYSCQKLQAAYDGGDVERMKDYIEYLCRQRANLNIKVIKKPDSKRTSPQNNGVRGRTDENSGHPRLCIDIVEDEDPHSSTLANDKSFNQMGLINNLRRHEVEDSLDLSIISNRRLEQELLSETVLDMATDMKGSQISPIKYIGGASANDDSHINVNTSKQLGTGPGGTLNKSTVNESSASKRATGISPFNRSKIGLHSMDDSVNSSAVARDSGVLAEKTFITPKKVVFTPRKEQSEFLPDRYRSPVGLKGSVSANDVRGNDPDDVEDSESQIDNNTQESPSGCLLDDSQFSKDYSKEYLPVRSFSEDEDSPSGDTFRKELDDETQIIMIDPHKQRQLTGSNQSSGSKNDSDYLHQPRRYQPFHDDSRSVTASSFNLTTSFKKSESTISSFKGSLQFHSSRGQQQQPLWFTARSQQQTYHPDMVQCDFCQQDHDSAESTLRDCDHVMCNDCLQLSMNGSQSVDLSAESCKVCRKGCDITPKNPLISSTANRYKEIEDSTQVILDLSVSDNGVNVTDTNPCRNLLDVVVTADDKQADQTTRVFKGSSPKRKLSRQDLEYEMVNHDSSINTKLQMDSKQQKGRRYEAKAYDQAFEALNQSSEMFSTKTTKEIAIQDDSIVIQEPQLDEKYFRMNRHPLINSTEHRNLSHTRLDDSQFNQSLVKTEEESEANTSVNNRLPTVTESTTMTLQSIANGQYQMEESGLVLADDEQDTFDSSVEQHNPSSAWNSAHGGIRSKHYQEDYSQQSSVNTSSRIPSNHVSFGFDQDDSLTEANRRMPKEGDLSLDLSDIIKERSHSGKKAKPEMKSKKSKSSDKKAMMGRAPRPEKMMISHDKTVKPKQTTAVLHPSDSNPNSKFSVVNNANPIDRVFSPSKRYLGSPEVVMSLNLERRNDEDNTYTILDRPKMSKFDAEVSEFTNEMSQDDESDDNDQPHTNLPTIITTTTLPEETKTATTPRLATENIPTLYTHTTKTPKPTTPSTLSSFNNTKQPLNNAPHKASSCSNPHNHHQKSSINKSSILEFKEIIATTLENMGDFANLPAGQKEKLLKNIISQQILIYDEISRYKGDRRKRCDYCGLELPWSVFIGFGCRHAVCKYCWINEVDRLFARKVEIREYTICCRARRCKFSLDKQDTIRLLEGIQAYYQQREDIFMSIRDEFY